MLPMLVVTATAVDISPILTDLVQVGALVLTGLVSWGVTKVAHKLHIDNQSAMAQAVTGALDNGIAYAQHALNQKLEAGAPIDLKNAVAAGAASYVVEHYKDWVKLLGIDESHLVATALAKLPV